MNLAKHVLAATALFCAALSCAHAGNKPAHDIPLPETSPQLRALIAAKPLLPSRTYPQTAQEWKTLRDKMAERDARQVPVLCKRFGVEMRSGEMAGVKVFTITPDTILPANHDRVLLHFHGGGYVFNPGKAGTPEAIQMAGANQIRVISVDYRMPPDYPYPAAMDDAVAVYRELLKQYPADKIGVFGTSTGGGMTLALVLRAKAEGLPLPGAIAPGTPWTDMGKTGDSYFINEGIDNILVSYDGFLKGAALLYANGHDLRDPMLSPVYGNVEGFPPTLLTSGTRDLFLSNTVRMHQKLREAGVTADLIVFEGMSHAHYLFGDTPEAEFHFAELGRFFDKYLK